MLFYKEFEVFKAHLGCEDLCNCLLGYISALKTETVYFFETLGNNY
jgi:hypothetical protein